MLAIFAFTLVLPRPAAAAQILVNGQELNAVTVIEKGTTLVPLRAIFQSLGATVDWDNETRTVTAVKGDIILKLQVGSQTAYRNGQPLNLLVPGKVIQGSTMVPLRFVSEALDAKVNWDSSGIITITSPSQSFDGKVNIVPVKRVVNSDPLYEAILAGLEEVKDSAVFDLDNKYQYDVKKVEDISKQVLEDHPDLSYINFVEVKIKTGPVTRAEIKYDYSFPTEKVKEMIKAVEAKSREIINEVIKPSMSDLEKEKALHDYVVLNTAFDYINYKNNTIPKESYSAYGVLIKGVGVCQGYASAMHKLLNMAGVEAKFITGTGKVENRSEPHGWNLVKINGQWYHLDTTWDDPAPDRPGKVSYKYFNLTDSEMRKDHSWE